MNRLNGFIDINNDDDGEQTEELVVAPRFNPRKFKQPEKSIVLLICLQFLVCLVGLTTGRTVRLCIASVDPLKLSSQCVMCNRREFPLTVIDCTGITKVNDLIANPLSVQEATCLIYNCRRQVPHVKPEPYHGSVSHAANYRGASSYQSASMSGSGNYEMVAPSGMFGGAHSQAAPMRFGQSNYDSNSIMSSPLSHVAGTPRGLIGGTNLLASDKSQALPYALVPAPSAFPFGESSQQADRQTDSMRAISVARNSQF